MGQAWRTAALAALAALCAASGARARAFTVDDLLRREGFGRVLLDPGERWVVVEQRDRQDSAGRYDLDQEAATWLSRLRVADLSGHAPARPLIAGDPRGVVAGGFSPSGERLAVYRLDAKGWRLGVVTIASGAVRWFEVVPDLPELGRGLAWLSDRELLVLDRTDRRPPWRYRMGHALADELPARWEASARGAASVTAYGSGAFANLTAAPAPVILRWVDVTTGATRELARGRFEDLTASADGRWAALRESRELVTYAAGRPLHGDWGVATRRQRLVLVDLRTGARQDLPQSGDLLPQVFTWSTGAPRLLVFARPDDQPWTRGRLRVIDPGAGTETDVQQDLEPLIQGRPEIVRAGWWGEAPILLGRRAGGRLDWYRLAPSGPVPLTTALPEAPLDIALPNDRTLLALAANKLWRIDRDGRARATPLPDARTVRGRRAWSDDQSWFSPASRLAVTLRGRQGGAVRIADPDGIGPPLAIRTPGEVVAVSHRWRRAVSLSHDAKGVETVALTDPQGAHQSVGRANAWLAEVDPPEVRAIRHAGPDGQPLTSWLFLPAPAATPPPLVVQAYSGAVHAQRPSGPPAPAGTFTDVRPLVGHGYAVLVPSLPKPRGTRDPMAGLADRIVGIVEAASQQAVGTFDPDRVALWGHSYGAYTIQGALTQSDRFRAGIAMAGTANLAGRWGEVPPARFATADTDIPYSWSAGWVESVQGGMGGPPWEDPDRYVRNSPFFAAGRITAPLMTVWGDNDLGAAGAMFAALARQGKDAIALTYWGEGHQLASPGNVRDFYDRAFAFLDRAFSVRPPTDRAARSGSPAPGSASSAPRPPSSPY